MDYFLIELSQGETIEIVADSMNIDPVLNVDFQGASENQIPVDDDGYTWIVGQYRYALDVYSWEIPMGGVPVGTDMLAGARRELKEETGLTAANWREILTRRVGGLQLRMERPANRCHPVRRRQGKICRRSDLAVPVTQRMPQLPHRCGGAHARPRNGTAQP